MTTKVFDQLETTSKRDRVLAVMRDSILEGQINPGDPIVESKLAQQMGVGQPLVREALIELEHQGFVQRLPYRGTYVTKMSREEVEQAYRIRVELEGLAVEWAQPNIKDEDVRQMREIVRGMKQGARSMDLKIFYDNDLALHRKIWTLSGNRYLVEALERVVVPLFAFFLMRTRRVKSSYVATAASHEKVVDALAMADAASARHLLIGAITDFKSEWQTKLLPENEQG